MDYWEQNLNALWQYLSVNLVTFYIFFISLHQTLRSPVM